MSSLTSSSGGGTSKEFQVGGKYRLVRRIGSGSFGDIYLGVNVTNGEVGFWLCWCWEFECSFLFVASSNVTEPSNRSVCVCVCVCVCVSVLRVCDVWTGPLSYSTLLRESLFNVYVSNMCQVCVCVCVCVCVLCVCALEALGDITGVAALHSVK